MVSAAVTCILPEHNGTPDVELYYELLGFRQLSHITYLEFSKPGSYLKLQQLPRNPEQYQRLRQFAMTHESLSALRTLYLRFAAFQTPDELDFIARTVRSAYSPYRWHEWLQ